MLGMEWRQGMQGVISRRCRTLVAGGFHPTPKLPFDVVATATGGVGSGVEGGEEARAGKRRGGVGED